MKISRYIIGMLLGLTVVLTLSNIMSVDSDADKYYDVTFDEEDEFGMADVRNASNTLVTKSGEMKEKLTLETDSGLSDVIGSIMATGLGAVDLIFTTMTAPFKILNSILSKVFNVDKLYIGIVEAIILFAIIFTLIRMKVKSDAA